MTMVAACQFRDGAIIISDSRASYELQDGKLMPNDTLQKIIPIGKDRVFCYAGSVSIANKALRRLQYLNRKKRQYQYLDSIIKKLPGLLRYVFNSSSQTERDGKLSVITGGKLLSGEIKFWILESPDFVPRPVKKFDVIGSGDVVRAYLESEIDEVSLLTDFKARFDSLKIGLDSALARHGIESVGGMFQAIIVSKKGIQPINHGYIDLSPLEPPEAAHIGMEEGVWTQHNQATGEKKLIVPPEKLLSQDPTEIRFHDYKTPEIKKKSRWHLNYFLTSSDVKISQGNIEFYNLFTIGSSINYPISIETILGVGFWGAAGKESLDIFLESEREKKKIKSIPFNILMFPEDLDLQEKVSFVIEKPGIHFIEAKIKDNVLARRAMFFYRIEENQESYEDKEFARKINGQAFNELIGSVDAVVEGGRAELVYFFLCENCVDQESILSVHHQFWIAYWKKYPLPLRCCLATAFRLSKGKHFVRVDLVDSANRESFRIDSASIESKSSCLINPIHSNTVIFVPRPGYYFINIYVDDKMVASSILIAESDKAKFSYSLLPDQEDEVASGQLLLLAKRAKPSNNQNLKRI